MEALLKKEALAMWQLPSFSERDTARSAIVVLQGRCDSKSAADIEKEITRIINGITPDGYVILHGDAGDFGLSSNPIHSDGINMIDGRGLKVLANCNDRAVSRNVHFIVVFSNPEVKDFFAKVSHYLTLPFTICSDEKQVEYLLQQFYPNPSSNAALPV